MAKIKKIKIPKTKMNWVHFAKFWSARGLGPEAASKILAENYLEKGWNDGVDYNMFKAPDMYKIGLDFVNYIEEFRKEKGLGFTAACEKIYKLEDDYTVSTLTFLLIPHAVDLTKKKAIQVSKGTFVKWCKDWRRYFYDKGTREQIEEEFRESKLLKLKTKKKKAKRK